MRNDKRVILGRRLVCYGKKDLKGVSVSHDEWPPRFTLDQESILNLLTGDRFYSNPSAALREAVLNAVDATHRLRQAEKNLIPNIVVAFDRPGLALTIADNGVGMSRRDVSALFTKVGASAAQAEAKKESVGEFGIGVISYFMAGDGFSLHTYDGHTEPIALLFSREMLAGGNAVEIPPTQNLRGTTLTISVKDAHTFELLLDSYAHWCRDVEGLSGKVDGEDIRQGDAHRNARTVSVPQPPWVERVHLGPVADPTGWDAMTGISIIAVLYRGVFVQEFEVRRLWGIEGSIDVDPKHFKPRMNREGFIAGQFQSEVEGFLGNSHPLILEAMAAHLASAVETGKLNKWTEKRWANLWLSVPRTPPYDAAVSAWDNVFRSLPAFEVAVGNKWQPTSIENLLEAEGGIYVAPLADDKSSDLVKAAVRFLRNSGKTVIRGIRRDKTWMRFAGASFATTADLITNVFGSELPPLLPIAQQAESVLAEIVRISPLFTGPLPIDLVRLGSDSPPALRLADRLVINVEHPAGAAIVDEVLRTNAGPAALIGIAARHAYEQLTQVAAVVKDITAEAEILSPTRRRFIRSCLS